MLYLAWAISWEIICVSLISGSSAITMAAYLTGETGIFIYGLGAILGMIYAYLHDKEAAQIVIYAVFWWLWAFIAIWKGFMDTWDELLS